MLVDMHLHECTYSTDSFLHLEEIVSIARQKGLDAICITDHDSMGLRERAEAYSREIGYPIFVGVEFFSLWGDITAWGIDGIPDQRQTRAYVSAKLAATILADMVAHLERDAWEEEVDAICSGRSLEAVFGRQG